MNKKVLWECGHCKKINETDNYGDECINNCRAMFREILGREK